MGTAVVAGERLAGRQMVDVLNAVGLDWATLGNHEFDVGRDALVARLAESRFGWVSGNVTTADGRALPGVVPTAVLTFAAPGGRPLRLGIVAATIPTGAPDWVRVADPLPALAEQARELRGRVDVLVALTHLDLEDDMRLAATVPEIDLVLGGHEHENWQVRRGGDLTPVTKADANARTAYVHRVRFAPAGGGVTVDSELVPVTAAIPEDPQVAAVVERWVDAAFAAFRASGFEPDAVVAAVPEPLDGRESAVRNRATGLTSLVAAAMLGAAPGADLAVFNAGSIRIDDVVPAGPLRQYDVIRVLPFGGEVLAAEMKGSLLARVLAQGAANRGTGGYLHTAGAAGPFAADATYRVAINDFLLSGRETGLAFLTRDHPDLRVVGEHGDVRRVVIAEARRRWGG
jgi:5'-nucleotidase